MTTIEDPVDELTRRRLLTGAGVLGVLTVLPGCGPGEEPAPPPAPEETTGGAFPVTVRHAYGEITVADEPKRVVSVGFNDHDAIAALGIVPVGMATWFDEYPIGYPWALKRYGDTPPEAVGLFYELNVEKVAALRPDLVIGVSTMDEATYRKLSRIAPTVGPPAGYDGATTPSWEEIQLMIGRALGREEQAVQLRPDRRAVRGCPQGASGVQWQHRRSRRVLSRYDPGPRIGRGLVVVLDRARLRGSRRRRRRRVPGVQRRAGGGARRPGRAGVETSTGPRTVPR